MVHIDYSTYNKLWKHLQVKIDWMEQKKKNYLSFPLYKGIEQNISYPVSVQIFSG